MQAELVTKINRAMTDAEFLERYRQTLKTLEEAVETAINEQDKDIDYEAANDMLTLSFTNKSVVIISRQTAIQQLWMAARSGGFHFGFDPARQAWICTTTAQTLNDMLEDICRQQGGVDMHFPPLA
jgi:CyaY protein